MNPAVPALLAVLAVAVIAARALFLWLRAVVRAVARQARLFGWGAAFGACLGVAHSHLPAALAIAAVTAIAAAAAVRVLARPGLSWGAA